MSVGRVLVAGTWDDGAGYPRTRSLLQALRADGLDVVELRVPLPPLTVSKSKLLRSPWRWPGYAAGLARVKLELAGRLRGMLVGGTPVDAILVPYPGHLAVSWIRRVAGSVPVLLDLFLPAWGTAVEDRRLFRPGSLPARALWALDRRACRAADLVLLDTPEHARVVADSLGLGAERFDWMPISDPEAPGAPLPARSRHTGEPLRLLYFGTGVALHGLRFLCDAVAAVEGVHLTLVGGTPEDRAHARAVLPAARLELGAEFEPPARIRARIAGADLVAGVFGTSTKAASVVPFKVVHALAAGRAVLTGDTPAIRGFLAPEIDCLVVPCGDAGAIARRLAELAAGSERLAAIGVAGRRTFDARFSQRALQRRARELLDRVAGLSLASSPTLVVS